MSGAARGVAVVLAIAASAVACGKSEGAGATGAPDGGSLASGDDSGGGAAPGDGAPGDAIAANGDAGPPVVPAMACSDALSDVYVAPSSLPPFDPSRRGDVVRCAPDAPIDASALASRLSSAGVSGVAVASSAHVWRVAYRTTRASGAEGMGTARVYLPDSPRAPLPVLVAAHGTSGLADVCAPSKYQVDDYLILPWVAQGYAVIAPDYAGLGDDGTPGYFDQVDTAQSVLDAARALRKLAPPGTFAPKVVVVGHSEGGGAALSSQALSKTYGDGDVAGVVAFAPGWPVGVDVSGYRDPTVATSTGSGYPAAFASMMLGAYFANRVGATHEGDPFGASARASLVTDLGTQCIAQLAASIPPAAPTVGDLLDATFRQSVLDCADAKPTCADPGKAYLAYLASNVQRADATGGKVLVVQGLADVVVAPASTACVVKKLVADGQAPEVCTDSSAGHLDVTQRQASLALSWVGALLAGQAAPSCDGSGMPSCP
jgi:alpha-beta hydrolase superfamily lysophospholipase